MKLLLPVIALLASGAFIAAQEREVPKDSSRITVAGCTKGRTFVVMAREGHEPAAGVLAPGRRFRLSGNKNVLNDIEKREGMMIEVTGLVRKAELEGPGGITAAGGRIRIGGGSPQAQTGSRPPMGGTMDAVLDVEGYNRLLEPCPSR